jgi:hypothetical protein
MEIKNQANINHDLFGKISKELDKPGFFKRNLGVIVGIGGVSLLLGCRVMSKIVAGDILAYGLNHYDILSFSNQLTLLNKPNLSAFLLMMFGAYSAIAILIGTIVTASKGTLDKKFSSVWIPFYYALSAALIIPTLPNNSSIMVETCKWVIKLVSQY